MTDIDHQSNYEVASAIRSPLTIMAILVPLDGRLAEHVGGSMLTAVDPKDWPSPRWHIEIGGDNLSDPPIATAYAGMEDGRLMCKIGIAEPHDLDFSAEEYLRSLVSSLWGKEVEDCETVMLERREPVSE
ncbi:hypothetical protein [Phaeobacter piscinae]|uniref:hypothetical protein n=1 Tax=Phaeobacter piscinae TaxID=1580596 RepID=UPI00058B1509|nr:hypothetical protein [Phaeobacter piscinae]UTS82221.1 hypothetical protein OL67_003325 [Phaeobacter piscinae]